MKELRILAPCGMLGYGFPKESFLRGIKERPHAIIVDAGSTDAGPHKLGAGVSIVSKLATKKDLEYIIIYASKLDIPVVIGSAGGAGSKQHVHWTIEIIQEILEENNIKLPMAVIWADIPKERVQEEFKKNNIKPLGPVPELTENILEQTDSIVAQMGAEPIIKALNEEAKIIICGRAYDPAPFAAVGIQRGFDPGLSYHLGKILECGALCADPGTTKDCILGILHEDDFIVKPLNPIRKCYPTSVAAHTFYEKEHPYILQGPGITLDLSKCEFQQMEEGMVRVIGSKAVECDTYTLKIEGSRQVAYRTFVLAGVRDPLMIEKIGLIEEQVIEQVANYFDEISRDQYKINFLNYGINAVMGKKETSKFNGYEIGILLEVLAKTQDMANTICASVRSTLLHYGYEGRKSTAGNLAIPFAPSDVEFGPVYEFSIYHLMNVKDGLSDFKIEYFGG